MPAKRYIDEELRARMCQMRKAGMPINKISAECHVCSRIVTETVAYVVCDKPAQGRSTTITQETLEAMRKDRASGMHLCDIAHKYHIWTVRARSLLDGTVEPDEDLDGFEPVYISISFSDASPVLNEDAFKAAGVPDNPINREACAGHSRAWMRLYKLRILHPDYLDLGDAVDAVATR